MAATLKRSFGSLAASRLLGARGSTGPRAGFHGPRGWRQLSSKAYELLGLEKGAGKRLARRRYLDLAWEVHPDRNSHVADSHKRFVALTEALKTVEELESCGSTEKPRVSSAAWPLDPRAFFDEITTQQQEELSRAAETMGGSGPDWGGYWQLAETMRQNGGVTQDVFAYHPKSRPVVRNRVPDVKEPAADGDNPS